MDAPVTNPSAAVPIGTRPTGSERLGLGQLSAPTEFDRPLNDPEAGAARRAIEDRREQDENRRGDDGGSERGFATPSDRELASRARVAAEVEAFQNRFAGSGEDRAPSDGGALDGAGVEALRRRVELAVSLAGPMEEPRRELNIVI